MVSLNLKQQKCNNKLRLLTGDLKFVSSFTGHKGCSALFPCAICRVAKGTEENAGPIRHLDEEEQKFSRNLPSLMPSLPASSIIPPALHLLHGATTKLLEIAEAVGNSAGINEVYKRKGAKKDPHTHKFTGEL
jgi:hypothetical protein